MPTSSDLVTDLPADFETFGQAVDTRLKALQPGTTLGDLAYSSATANTNTRLAIGSTGQVLTVSGGVPTWAANTSGMTLLSTTTLSGATTTIGTISGSYNTLYAVIYGVTYTGSSEAFVCRPNAATTGTDSNSFYSYGTTAANTATPDNQMFISYLSGTVSSNANSFVLQINNYASTASFKPYQSYGQLLHVGGSRATVLNAGGYRSTSAITSLEFAINTSGTSFTAGTVLLYGVK